MAVKVQDKSDEVRLMEPAWDVAEALLGGTAAMRAAGSSMLPRWPNEEDASYAVRLGTATLFPALARTVSVMAGKPFAKALTLGDDVPPRVREWCDDFDLQGRNLHAFAADLMAEAMAYGLCGVLVDHPPVATDVVRTQADEARLRLRPYAVPVRHRQILGWRTAVEGGAARLVQLRLAETRQRNDGEYGASAVARVRVLRPGSYEVWEHVRDDDYALVEQGATTMGVIPFVPFYGRRLHFMNGMSPLLELAHLNVKHWQSQSDQDTILHVARVPILAAVGNFDERWELTVGASSAVKLPAGSELKYVEHGGKAIEAGEVALTKLEDQMVQTGAELLVVKPGEQRSATQANNDAEANKSDLQRLVESFEDGLDQVLQLMAVWAGMESGGHVSLFKDFGVSSLTDASAQLVLSMQQAGLITKATAIREQQRRGMLAADIDPELELERVAEEGPVPGTLTDDGDASQRPTA